MRYTTEAFLNQHNFCYYYWLFVTNMASKTNVLFIYFLFVMQSKCNIFLKFVEDLFVI